MQTHQQRWVRAGDSFCTILSLVGMHRLQHVADESQAHCGALPGCTFETLERIESTTGGGYWALRFGWKRGPCTNSSAGCPVIFSRRVKRKDLHWMGAGTSCHRGTRGMVRLRSGRGSIGQCRWGNPLPLTESGARRRAQEKAVRLTMEFFQQRHSRSKGAKHSDPWTGPQLRTGAEGSK